MHTDVCVHVMFAGKGDVPTIQCTVYPHTHYTMYSIPTHPLYNVQYTHTPTIQCTVYPHTHYTMQYTLTPTTQCTVYPHTHYTMYSIPTHPLYNVQLYNVQYTHTPTIQCTVYPQTHYTMYSIPTDHRPGLSCSFIICLSVKRLRLWTRAMLCSVWQ